MIRLNKDINDDIRHNKILQKHFKDKFKQLNLELRYVLLPKLHCVYRCRVTLLYEANNQTLNAYFKNIRRLILKIFSLPGLVAKVIVRIGN